MLPWLWTRASRISPTTTIKSGSPSPPPIAWMIFEPFSCRASQPLISTPSSTLNSPGSSPWDTKRIRVYTVLISVQHWLSWLHCFRMSVSPELSIQSSPFSGATVGLSETLGISYSVPSILHRVQLTEPVEL